MLNDERFGSIQQAPEFRAITAALRQAHLKAQAALEKKLGPLGSIAIGNRVPWAVHWLVDLL